jgi:transcriptional regulator with XRE-family HTH domain
MGQTALGVLLEHLRELRGFSLRDLSDLSKVDHAYIYRLEKGDKESPSAEVLARLIRPLKAAAREAAMLHYLAEHTETDPGLVTHVLLDNTITYDVFGMVAGAAHRGKKPDYAKLIARARAVLADEDGLG